MKSSKIILLIVGIFIALSSVVVADGQGQPPSKKDLEEMFGQAVSCIRRWQVCLDDKGKEIKCVEPKDTVCYKNDRNTMLINVHFDKSDFAKNVVISDGINFPEAVGLAEEIILLNGRGKLLKKVIDSSGEGNGGCLTHITEEYQYLSMDYSSKQCINATPGTIIVTWKH